MSRSLEERRASLTREAENGVLPPDVVLLQRLVPEDEVARDFYDELAALRIEELLAENEQQNLALENYERLRIGAGVSVKDALHFAGLEGRAEAAEAKLSALTAVLNDLFQDCCDHEINGLCAEEIACSLRDSMNAAREILQKEETAG